jgi:hypothetical protein
LRLEEERRTLHREAHPKMTLQSAKPCVKATSRSSTARPQEKAECGAAAEFVMPGHDENEYRIGQRQIISDFQKFRLTAG